MILKNKDRQYLLRTTGDYWPYAEVIIADIYSKFDLRSDDIVLDLGANIGLFTVKISNKVKKVISIEPEPENFSILKKNVDMNGLTNVVLVNQALSDKKKVVKIENIGVESKISNLGNEIQADTLDNILSEKNISNPTIIKMDIEGEEKAVFESTKILKSVREIIVEVHGDENRESVLKILKKNGFNIEDTSEFNPVNAINEMIRHPISFLSGEKKNKFALTKLCVGYLCGKRQKPGSLNQYSNISMYYAKKI
ncbi:putative RNA methylase ral function prediction only protein [Marine Group I thaumarchaeote SCGC AAA799-B03]|uniref:Putative RNA methylase ral function prediction only protein n=1 Tax=Marine Group I thaumarchaeote SCGC AAA799-B03 TaxID=1502289 RepID=A0A087S916_9ARCH|nr:putative RNA methylase ral function prediction only protein [Marine Group I thaumarchaeote SCGC AAA799-B03]